MYIKLAIYKYNSISDIAFSNQNSFSEYQTDAVRALNRPPNISPVWYFLILWIKRKAKMGIHKYTLVYETGPQITNYNPVNDTWGTMYDIDNYTSYTHNSDI